MKLFTSEWNLNQVLGLEPSAGTWIQPKSIWDLNPQDWDLNPAKTHGIWFQDLMMLRFWCLIAERFQWETNDR